MDEKRRIYERLVQATLLIEEASTQAARAAQAGAKLRQRFTKLTDFTAALTEMQTALHRSAECTREASTLIAAA